MNASVRTDSHETTHPDPQPRSPRQPGILAILVLVAAVALVFRQTFVANVLRHHSPDEIQAICSDSAEYLGLAGNLSVYRPGAEADPELRHAALQRPPGYPLFCALMGWLGFPVTRIVIAQAVIGVCIPVATALLAWWIVRSRLAAVLAGLISALSPTGVGLSAVVLADLLFAAAFVVGLVLLYHGIAGSKSGVSFGAGAVFGIATLIKPALVVWSAASPMIWLLFARSARVPVRRGPFVAFLSVQVAFVGALCVRNQLAEGCFTPSAIGPKNLRYYVAPRVEAWAQAGQAPRGSAILEHRKLPWERDKAQLAAGEISSAEIVERQYAESLAILREHPMETARVCVLNIREGLTDGWTYLPAQLPAATGLRSALENLGRVARKMQKPAFVIAGLGLLALGVGGWLLRDERLAGQLHGTLALLVTVGVFAALSGTTFWTGSRIMYPCEFALILLPVSGVVGLVRLVRRVGTRQAAGDEPAPRSNPTPRPHVVRAGAS